MSIIGEAIGESVSGVINAVGDQIQKKTVLEADLIKTEIQADTNVAIAQNKVNEVQAASADKFTSRARPCTMYLCMVIILYAGIIQPFIIMIAKLFHNPIDMPSIGTTDVTIILMSLCGLRSFEKVKGITSSWVDPK